METKLAHDRASEPGPGRDPLASLVARIASGDEAALRALYDSTSARTLGIATQILRDSLSAEEAVVEVYAQVWRQAGRYDAAKGLVSTWIATLARTRAIDVRRARQRHGLRHADLDSAPPEALRDSATGPLDAALERDRAERVQAALRTLPKEQQSALEAAFFGGFSHTEIAAALGQPLGTVKTRIRSGLIALRRALATFEGELA